MHKYSEFARILNHYLIQQDRSPSWLANRLGINPATVSRWLNEHTRPGDSNTIVRIADLIGMHAASDRQAFLSAAGYDLTSSVVAETGVQGEVSLLRKQTNDVTRNDKVHIEGISDHDPTEGRIGRSIPYLVPPLPVQGVLGRDALMGQVRDQLRLNENATEVLPVALFGMGGIGKTTTAIAFGRDRNVLQQFPDGVLWVSLGPEPSIRLLLNDWGEALGTPLWSERDEESCHQRLRMLLHNRRMLLIIDDVWEVAHGQIFALAGPHCRTILTTRESPVAHTLATRGRTLRVDVLSLDSCMELLRRLAPEAVHSDVETAQRLCERLEYLPLALTLAGRMLANELDVPYRLQRLVDELIERRQARLQLLQVEGRPGLDSQNPISLRTILGMSVERLTRMDQERFAMLSIFGGEPLTWELQAAAHIWSCSLDEAAATTSLLIQRGLVTRQGEYYWMHALLADYAEEMLETIQ